MSGKYIIFTKPSVYNFSQNDKMEGLGMWQMLPTFKDFLSSPRTIYTNVQTILSETIITYNRLRFYDLKKSMTDFFHITHI